jgi:para-nitrobenzyl esterase
MFSNPPANWSWTTADTELASMKSSYWVNFAAKGNPNGKGLRVWTPYNAKTNV